MLTFIWRFSVITNKTVLLRFTCLAFLTVGDLNGFILVKKNRQTHSLRTVIATYTALYPPPPLSPIRCFLHQVIIQCFAQHNDMGKQFSWSFNWSLWTSNTVTQTICTLFRKFDMKTLEPLGGSILQTAGTGLSEVQISSNERCIQCPRISVASWVGLHDNVLVLRLMHLESCAPVYSWKAKESIGVPMVWRHIRL